MRDLHGRGDRGRADLRQGHAGRADSRLIARGGTQTETEACWPLVRLHRAFHLRGFVLVLILCGMGSAGAGRHRAAGRRLFGPSRSHAISDDACGLVGRSGRRATTRCFSSDAVSAPTWCVISASGGRPSRSVRSIAEELHGAPWASGDFLCALSGRPARAGLSDGGIARSEAGAFLLYDLLGALISVPIVVSIGYLFGAQIEMVIHYLGGFERIIWMVVVLLAGF